jgi:hypothetical protein
LKEEQIKSADLARKLDETVNEKIIQVHSAEEKYQKASQALMEKQKELTSLELKHRELENKYELSMEANRQLEFKASELEREKARLDKWYDQWQVEKQGKESLCSR